MQFHWVETLVIAFLIAISHLYFFMMVILVDFEHLRTYHSTKYHQNYGKNESYSYRVTT